MAFCDNLSLDNPMNPIIDYLEDVARRYPLYKPRRKEYADDGLIPFRVSPQPLTLSKTQYEDLVRIGSEVTAYFRTVEHLYNTNHDVEELLDRNLPSVMGGIRSFNFLFVRPDLIITNEGFRLCEIETSSFGLSLADILNRAYIAAGIQTMVGQETLSQYLRANTAQSGLVIDSTKTKAFEGQLRYLAERLLSGEGRQWALADMGSNLTASAAIWRAFYLGDYNADPLVHQFILDQIDKNNDANVIPGLSPQMEEKAVLALIWDKRFDGYFRDRLGEESVLFLRQLIPPTWVVGSESYFLPGGFDSALELSQRSSRNRRYVLKSSGFGDNPSWGEGVNFLHKLSANKCAQIITKTVNDADLYIIQEYKEGIKISSSYLENGSVIKFEGRARITPYYAVGDGSLLAIKATLRANTELIHASTDSINTAVAVS